MTASIVAQQIDAGDRLDDLDGYSTVNIDQQIENYLSRFDAMTPEQKRGQFDLALTMLPDVLPARRRCPYCRQDLQPADAPAPIDADRLDALRTELEDWAADGHPVAPMIFDNLAWFLAMEDAGYVIGLESAMPVAFDVTRPPTLPFI